MNPPSTSDHRRPDNIVGEWIEDRLTDDEHHDLDTALHQHARLWGTATSVAVDSQMKPLALLNSVARLRFWQNHSHAPSPVRDAMGVLAQEIRTRAGQLYDADLLDEIDQLRRDVAHPVVQCPPSRGREHLYRMIQTYIRDSAFDHAGRWRNEEPADITDRAMRMIRAGLENPLSGAAVDDAIETIRHSAELGLPIQLDGRGPWYRLTECEPPEPGKTTVRPIGAPQS